jgi:hypothetical protein
MQKVIYLLQAAGCPFQTEFRLHLFGPYSQEVADLTDEMVQEGLLQETNTPNAVGRQFSYTPTPATLQGLEQLEKNSQGRGMAKPLEPFKGRFRALLGADLRELELAATIAFYRERGLDWAEAEEAAARFKSEPAESLGMQRACQLARSVVQP